MTDPDLRNSPEPPPRWAIYVALLLFVGLVAWLCWLISVSVLAVLP